MICSCICQICSRSVASPLGFSRASSRLHSTKALDNSTQVHNNSTEAHKPDPKVHKQASEVRNESTKAHNANFDDFFTVSFSY